MPIPQDIIDRILRDTDIVEVIGERLPLKRAGSNFKGLCPFHGEKTPSFNVNQPKQIFHCFGCGKGGNVITFLMEMDRLNFPETVERLAERAGIAIPKDQAAQQAESRNDIYLKINAYALWYFENESSQSVKVHEYLRNRGLDDQTIKTFSLGYAPPTGQGLVKYLEGKKVPFRLVEDLGLARRRDDGSSYDFFRDRLIFPISNKNGKIIAFGGRDLSGDSPAKYINSQESPVYFKGRELYGFKQAKDEILSKKEVIIVEGYMDVLACHQLGLKNVVAPLGTSLTEKQVQILRRMTERIVLMFDGDSAGKKALVRAAELCMSAGVHPYAVVLPDDRDPGDFLLAEDKSALAEIVRKAALLMDWVMGVSLAKLHKPGSDKTIILKSLVGWLNKLPDPIEVLTFRQKVENRLGLRLGELDKFIAKQNVSARTERLGAPPLELLLLWLFLQKPQEFPQQALTSLEDGFSRAELKMLARKLEEIFERNATMSETLAIAEMSAELQAELSGILMYEFRPIEDYDVANCLELFKRHTLKQRVKNQIARIHVAESRGAVQETIGLLREQQEILKAK